MSRQALQCPSCGRALAYRRRGGSVVPEPFVSVVPLPYGGATLECPNVGCGEILKVGGDRVVIPPRIRATIPSN